MSDPPENSVSSMQSSIYRLFLILVTALLIPTAHADVVTLDPEAPRQNLSPQIRYFKDSSGSRSIDEIIRHRPELPWLTDGSAVPNFGFNEHPFWIHFHLANPSENAVERYLSINYPLLDDVDIYRVTDNQVKQQWHLGDTQPFGERVILNRNFVVPVTFEPESSTHIYIRVDTTSSMQLPIELTEPRHFHQTEFREAVLQFLFYGGLLVMVIYNLFLFLSIKNISYLFYVFYITNIIFLYLAVQGYGFQLLWPDQPWFNSKNIITLASSAVVVSIVFSISFLQTRRYTPRTHQYLLGLLAVTCGFLVANLFLPYSTMIKPTLLLNSFAAASLLVISIIVWRSGNRSARYYTIAWATLIAGIVMINLNKLGVLPRNLITEHAMQLGVLLEALLLSFALADRINRERREKFEAQKLAIHNENLAREEHERYLQTKLKAEVDELKAKEATIQARAESKAK
ncbi:MAG: 7TM diverse intracellular signaling domain-containing protein, partial [Ketobacteraceae bacterium]|nr:7TM diverse intracellular signaling domain-containing protein [Ketobacteraceae bacterium]